MRIGSWIRHLKNRRGHQFVGQMLRMWNFHRTSFEDLLTNIFESLDSYSAKFTFPTVASVTPYHPDSISFILHEGHEIANHGYKHVKYPFLSDRQQELEFQKSVDIFQQLRIPIHGFRAPYNSYNERTIELVQEFGFEWDGGFGYKPEYRRTHDMFRYVMENGSTMDTVSIPCHRYSDDLLIDRYLMDPENLSKLWRAVIRKASGTGGVLMFDLHPIRIGQKRYAKVLQEMAEEAHALGAWMPRTVDAVRQWKKEGKWAHDFDFCVLFTGDIDNFVFFDYLRRLI